MRPSDTHTDTPTHTGSGMYARCTVHTHTDTIIGYTDVHQHETGLP